MATVQECFINLRNDFKTWITNNLILKVNKSDLTASDGTAFKFGVTPEGEYGYVLNINGEDRVIPFSGAVKQDLYEALKISGLVTETMTLEDMYFILLKEFPMIYEYTGGI